MAVNINASLSSGVGITSDNSGAIQFQSNGTNTLFINTSGNVGIGVTPSAWSLTGGNIELPSSAAIGFSGPNGIISTNGNYNTNWIYKTTGAATYYQGTNGVHVWGNAPSGTAGTAITFTERVRIDLSGNLGIGTNAPQGKLEVAAGDIWISDNGNSNASQNYLYFANGSTRRAYIGGLFGTQAAGSPTELSFATNAGGADASERMRIDSSGNLLIGGTSTLDTAILMAKGRVRIGDHAYTSETSGMTTPTGTYNALNIRSLVTAASYSRYYALIAVNTAYAVSGNNPPTSLMLGGWTNGASYAGGIEWEPATTSLHFLTGASMTGFADANRKMTLDSSGNLGIGLTPSYPLDIQGNVSAFGWNIRGRASDNIAVGRFATNNNTETVRLRADADGTFGIYNTSSVTQALKVDSAQTLFFNSGYGSAAAAYGCRAWINFNASSGTPVIRNDGNVTSLTDNGVGDFTLNFTTAFPDVNYSVVGSANSLPGSAETPSTRANVTLTSTWSTSAVRFYTSFGASSTAANDASYACLAVFR